MKGISLVSSNSIPNDQDMQSIKSIHANWVSLNPYAFLRKNSGHLFYNHRRQWKGERIKGIAEMAAQCHKNGLKVMIKPHVWVSEGMFTGEVGFSTDEEWKAFESEYSDYILSYAELADSLNLELLCIGTEWKNFVQSRPEYWENLILKIRDQYKGPLVYAANWDEYELVPFWDQLDYIGIDAYMPLDSSRIPQKNTLINSWNSISKQINDLSDAYQKHVIFTEFGYRSIEYTAHEPWRSYHEPAVSLEAQAIAFDAFFNSVWQDKHVVGGFIWKWYQSYDDQQLKRISGFTPQHKPAEQIIRGHYSRSPAK